jgi:hypothetical protein
MLTNSPSGGLGLCGIKYAWMKTPDLEFHMWAQAAQRLWLWLKTPTHGDQTQFRFTDRQLAKILGVGRRCIQYALQWLEEHGIIRRWFQYGARDVAGRVIEITIELATKEPATKKPARPAPAAKGAPAPPPVIKKPEPEPEPTPEEIAATQAILDEIRKNAAQAATKPTRPEQRAKARAEEERTFEGQRLRRSIDSANRQLERLRSLPGAETDPVLLGEIARLEALAAQCQQKLDQMTPARE